jgi:TonB family protein
MKRLFCLLIILFLTLAGVSLAQTITSTISGIVKDDFGNLIEGATVTVRDEERQEIAVARSDDKGKYEIGNLPIGSYKITVEREGLNSESISDIKLSVAAEVKLDLTMQLNLEGKAIKKISPTYPDLARMTRQEGRAIVGVLVKPDGTVEKALFLSGNPAFKTAALQAAQRWVFQKTNSGLSGRIAFTFKF